VSAAFRMVESGRMTCTKIREKLLNLTSHGNLRFVETPGEEKGRPIDYSLAGLVLRYFKVDISESKSKDTEDNWRTNFSVLEDRPVAEWPPEAVKYAADDAEWAEAVYIEQEKVRRQIIEAAGHDPFETLEFQVAVDFALGWMTARGVKTDPERVIEIRDEIAAELTGDKVDLLIERGILRPAEPPRPYANGARQHVEDCNDKKNCDCPPKMTSGKAESVDTGKLAQYVERICKERPEEFKLKKTKPSTKFPEGQVSVDADWRAEYAHKDPLLSQYHHRAELQKMVNTEIPRMMWEGEVAPVVFPGFDVLKVTGRTSSFGGNLYPSFNCQNVDPRMRHGYVPRAGMVMFSIDYSAMELGTFAQTCLNLFGQSRLAEIIRAGKDPHAYLGAQIALHLDEDFRELASSEIDMNDLDGAYEVFSSLKDDERTEGFFKHYRTFAKPTGLGYPGGLGADTFRAYAKGTFGIDVDLETAKRLKDIWKRTLPEAEMFFRYINEDAVDDLNGPKTYTAEVFDDETGEWKKVRKTQDRYRYTTPMGMVRMGCDYCAACNGLGLQSPSGEGAKLAVFETVRECYDPTQKSPLSGKVFPLMFIHDEIVGEVVDSDEATSLVNHFASIMVKCMECITPDVPAKAEPVLMTRWDKFAKPTYIGDCLIPYNPDQGDETSHDRQEILRYEFAGQG